MNVHKTLSQATLNRVFKPKTAVEAVKNAVKHRNPVTAFIFAIEAIFSGQSFKQKDFVRDGEIIWQLTELFSKLKESKTYDSGSEIKVSALELDNQVVVKMEIQGLFGKSKKTLKEFNTVEDYNQFINETLQMLKEKSSVHRSGQDTPEYKRVRYLDGSCMRNLETVTTDNINELEFKINLPIVDKQNSGGKMIDMASQNRFRLNIRKIHQSLDTITHPDAKKGAINEFYRKIQGLINNNAGVSDIIKNQFREIMRYELDRAFKVDNHQTKEEIKGWFPVPQGSVEKPAYPTDIKTVFDKALKEYLEGTNNKQKMDNFAQPWLFCKANNLNNYFLKGFVEELRTLNFQSLVTREKCIENLKALDGKTVGRQQIVIDITIFDLLADETAVMSSV